MWADEQSVCIDSRCSHTHRHRHTHTYTQTHKRTHTHTHTHTHTYTHTHTHTHTHASMPWERRPEAAGTTAGRPVGGSAGGPAGFFRHAECTAGRLVAKVPPGAVAAWQLPKTGRAACGRPDGSRGSSWGCPNRSAGSTLILSAFFAMTR